MFSKPILTLSLLGTLLSAAILWSVATPAALAQAALILAPGVTTSGEITSRLGQEWTFQACAGDTITLTATSEDFVPFLALADASGELLIEAEGAEATLTAAITAFNLPSSGSYTLLVAGSTVRDRGPYALTLTTSTSAEATNADTPFIVAGQSITGEVTSRFGSEILFVGCAGGVANFTLESDAFVPHLELFGPDGRDPLITNTASGAGAAAQISDFTLPEAGLYTLIASGESVRDRGPFTLVAGVPANQGATVTATATPTPTSTPTATPTPAPTSTPTSAPQASALDPQGIVIQVNGGDGDLMGEIFMNPSYMVSAMDEDDTIVVRDRFYLELFVMDPEVGFYYGAGIDRVEFIFSCPNGEEYVRIERTPRYCSFSDSGGNCNVLRIRSGEMFPGSNCEIVNSYYPVTITAYPTNPDREPGNWVFSIRPDIP